MDFPKLIKSCRHSLSESQADFAKRFNTQANTVSRWESGQYQAPYEVLSFVLDPKPNPDLIYTCWANEAGCRLTVHSRSRHRVYFQMTGDDTHEVSIEKHHVKNLADELTKFLER